MVGFADQPGRGALASRSPTSNRPPLDWLSLLVGLGRTQRFQCKLAQPNRITLAALGELDDLFSNDPCYRVRSMNKAQCVQYVFVGGRHGNNRLRLECAILQ